MRFVSPPPNEWKTRNPWSPEQCSSIFLNLFMVTYNHSHFQNGGHIQSLPRSAPYLGMNCLLFLYSF